MYVTLTDTITRIRSALSDYVYRCRSESELQAQVVGVLGERMPEVHVDTEVRKGNGRFDVVLRGDWGVPRFVAASDQWSDGAVRGNAGLLVLELKVKSSAAAVERQAQRYALIDDVCAVIVVTTSRRLASELSSEPTLGGKPFAVIALRSS